MFCSVLLSLSRLVNVNHRIRGSTFSFHSRPFFSASIAHNETLFSVSHTQSGCLHKSHFCTRCFSLRMFSLLLCMYLSIISVTRCSLSQTKRVTTTQRDQIYKHISYNMNAWNDQMKGYDCWPYDHLTVKVVGWAVTDAYLLAWGNETGVPVYVNAADENSIVTCPK